MNIRDIQEQQDQQKIRALTLATCLTYWMWHFLYKWEFDFESDLVLNRVLISVYGFIVFYLAAYKKFSVEKIRPFYLVGLILILTNEAILLGVSNWSFVFVFSYFAVALVVSTSALCFFDYVLLGSWGVLMPMIVNFFVPHNILIVTQMVTCCAIVFFFVGFTIRANFLHRSELMQQNMAAIQNSKMAALGQMAAGIAHEINNPLAIVRGKADQLIRTLQKEGEINRSEVITNLSKISLTADRIAKIIKGLKSFSRDSEGDPMVESDIEMIVKNTLSLCEERITSSGVKLHIENVPSAAVLCHESQLTQVLLNLLNNAFDALQDCAAKEIEIRFRRVGSRLQILVSDSGPGIPKEIQHKLMEPFFTTKELGKGTGLGLSISRGIAANHGGQLFLDNNHRKTCFILELPLLETSAERAG